MTSGNDLFSEISIFRARACKAETVPYGTPYDKYRVSDILERLSARTAPSMPTRAAAKSQLCEGRGIRDGAHNSAKALNLSNVL